MTQQFFNIDLLKLYFGDPYPISDKIIIHQPSILEIIEYGEAMFFAMLYMFIGNTTMKRLDLWNIGIDWNKVSDFELFCSLIPSLPKNKTEILFGDIDFTKFVLLKMDFENPKSEDEQDKEEPQKKMTATEKRIKRFKEFEDHMVLYNEEQEIIINIEIYRYLVGVLRNMFHVFPKTEYTVGKTSKQLIIDEEKANRLKMEKDSEKPTSTLLPLISACVNHPGFKYKTSELKQVKINEFMDSVQRLQVYESTHALLGGMYSGFCDTSKIPRDNFNFMRSIK